MLNTFNPGKRVSTENHWFKYTNLFLKSQDMFVRYVYPSRVEVNKKLVKLGATNIFNLLPYPTPFVPFYVKILSIFMYLFFVGHLYLYSLTPPHSSK